MTIKHNAWDRPLYVEGLSIAVGDGGAKLRERLSRVGRMHRDDDEAIGVGDLKPLEE